MSLLFGLCRILSANQVIVWGDNTYHQTNVPASATNVISMAAGDEHCIVLRADGTVVAWGGNSSGQTNVPSNLTNVVEIAAGSTDSLALRKDGTVAMWGQILNSGIATVPPNATNIIQIAKGPGAQHAMALREDGSVVDWGAIAWGPELAAIPSMATNVVSVAAGAFFGVALRADGTVVAWGANAQNALFIPSTATNIVAIAAGWYGSVGLRADGTIALLGLLAEDYPSPFLIPFTNLVDVVSPFDGSLGDDGSTLGLRQNGTIVQYSPQYRLSASNITAIAAAGYNGMVATAAGPPVFPGLPANRRVSSGLNAYFRAIAVGALPMYYQWNCNGTNIPGATNSIFTLSNVQPDLAGNAYTLIATNALGAATNGPMVLSESPQELYAQASTAAAVVDQTVTWKAQSVGAGPFTYQWQFDGTNLPTATNATFTVSNAQLSDAGSYSIIATNSFGVISNSFELAVTPTIVTNPIYNQVAFPGGAATFSIGLQAIIPVAYQWQYNGTNIPGATNTSLTLTNLQYPAQGTYSVLFSDSFETVTNKASLSVVTVAAWGQLGEQLVAANITNVIGIACGFSHELALLRDGTVVGWGTGPGPIIPPGLSNVIAISAGNNSSLALRSDGSVVAWGQNTYGETNVPPWLANVIAIAAGSFHNLALQSNGNVVAWGDNTHGETNVPPGLTNVVAIAADQGTSLALKADGTVVGWGDNTYNESLVPSNISNAVQIATGGDHALVLTANGIIIGWGNNGNGQNTPPVGLSNIVRITAGFGHSAVLTAGGTVVAWGSDVEGEIDVPSSLSNAVELAANSFQTMALIGSAPPLVEASPSNLVLTTNGFTFSLPSSSGRVYTLESKSSLSDSNWTPLSATSGTGGLLKLADPTPSTSQRFYRVKKW